MTETINSSVYSHTTQSTLGQNITFFPKIKQKMFGFWRRKSSNFWTCSVSKLWIFTPILSELTEKMLFRRKNSNWIFCLKIEFWLSVQKDIKSPKLLKLLLLNFWWSVFLLISGTLKSSKLYTALYFCAWKCKGVVVAIARWIIG